MPKLQFLGTGSILSDRNSACLLIDQRILVDVPNGIVKVMRRNGLERKKIKLVCITHYHGDHCFDLPFLFLDLALRQVHSEPLTIIGPPGIEERAWSYLDLAFPEAVAAVRANLRPLFYQASDKRIIEVDSSVKVHCFQMLHGSAGSYGFVIDLEGNSVGVTGDTRLCDNVHSLIQASGTCVLDMTFPQSTADHMGADDVAELGRTYFGRRRMFATHMSDAVRSTKIKGIEIPDDLQQFEV